MMDYTAAKHYLLSRPDAWPDRPFGEDILVAKIKNNMFATLSNRNNIPQMNLKCDPDQALALRDIFSAILPGYHMNKKHWNTLILDGSIPHKEIERLIDHSYSLVVKSLKASERRQLELIYSDKQLYR